MGKEGFRKGREGDLDKVYTSWYISKITQGKEGNEIIE